MSPDVVLVPPMGYGPEVRHRLNIFSDHSASLGGYLECGLYSDRNGNGQNAVS